ncbi:hypothetical protein PV08_05904 [Exophiala spinifera]|uniref:Uncharacterized protein n=1 Tax=Exophiala spinifera TaxID=91928 RepID=A0A0D2BX22_9EURO|nr:uncharacterized protein PV08_05904 [Exophiala spinifera]KIW15854.1 hypothetical protein PV08_05904 [Exophiala spinifera]
MIRNTPPKPSSRRRRHSRKYAPSSEEFPEPLDKKKQEKNKVERKPRPPGLSELLGSYFVTGGRAGDNTRAELRTIERDIVEREATRPRDPKPGEIVFKEPPRPEAVRRERIKIEQAQAEVLRETRRREEVDLILRRHETERQTWEQELRQREQEIRKYEAELQRLKYERQFETLHREQEDKLRRKEDEYRRREEDFVRKHEAELRHYKRERDVEVQRHESERQPHQVQVDHHSEPEIIVREQNPRSESRGRSRHGTDSDSDDRPPDQPEPRPGLRGGGPSGGARYRAETEPEDLIYIFYVRYGEIKEISTDLSPRRQGGIGRWTDKRLLTHLVERYRRQSGNEKWWTWRYWWDSFMKEIAALILIQMEESTVFYERIPYPGERQEPPITDLRRRVKRSIDLFGGKEASGQFRYLIRHYKTMTDSSRIITSQIDRLAISGQQDHAESAHYKYYLLLEVVEGQNGQAFLLGILIIILCFLAFGLALGATQASSISWGDVFSISGFGLAALSGLFALMGLAQYLGLEDMSPGNPISRDTAED